MTGAAKAWMRARGQAQLSMAVGVDNRAARRLYERLGFVGTGEISTVTYDYVDADGISRTATETDERLVTEVSGLRARSIRETTYLSGDGRFRTRA